jgi:cytochrome b involved in lipid metabolism
VTEFLDKHPGGKEVLIEHSGLDATEYFEEIGHSSEAEDLMKEYRIGKTFPMKEENKEKIVNEWNYWNDPEGESIWKSWSSIAAIIALLVHTIFQIYYTNYL